MYDGNDPARGRHIAAMRNARLMTQAALATAAGTHVGTVRRAEAGKPLSAETAAALCAVFDIAQDGLAVTANGHGGPSETSFAPPKAADVGTTATFRSGMGWLRRRTSWDLGFAIPALVAVLLQPVAYGGPWLGMDDWWGLYELVAAAAYLVAIGVLVAELASRSPSPWARAAGAGCLAAMLAMTTVMARNVLWVSPAATERALVDLTSRYGYAGRIVHVRQVMEPTWNPNRALWEREASWLRALGHWSDEVETPGTFAHWREVREACRAEFESAPTYDQHKCAGSVEDTQSRSWRRLADAVAGRSWLPATATSADPKASVAGDGFAKARAVYDAHHPAGRRWTPDDDKETEAEARTMRDTVAETDGSAAAGR